MRFDGRWRHYQQIALEAFERDRARGHRHTHIVAPPGSGKTLLGLEMVARIGAPALVLVPNSAVQAGWLRAVRAFGATEREVTVLTYQALCQFDDPALVLGDLAERRWAAERAAATGRPPEEVVAEAAAWTGEAARRRDSELRRISASLKREIARAEHGALHLGQLMTPTARGRLDDLRAAGVGTLVLDECHHLASLWGYAVRAAVEELGDVHLIGLTATPPGELSREEAELYEHLLGPVDFTVPTPAVVREGHLAPFQELAWLTRPLDSEARWLAEHDSRFRELITTLHDDDLPGTLSMPAWVITRMRGRSREGEEAEIPWASFARANPRLARAGARFLASGGLALPRGVPSGEGYREPPSLEDWLVLLEDYSLRCLRADPSPEAAARDAQIAAALRDLGFNLTRQGIRRGGSDVDRLLTSSAAKPIALVEVAACELDARGERLRALVLADTEEAAAGAVRALADDIRTAPTRPLLVSGRGLRCAPWDAEALLAALGAERAGEEDEAGLVTLSGDGDWRPRVWIERATAAFTAGEPQALVGTRSLLGEGWDAPCVNCLIDLTAAATSVSVNQMRGRSLRLDPADPEKIASNWDVVCVADELVRGDADYERFVRKHMHLYAPTEDGAIEAGPSHVHPELSPFTPPGDERFAEINAQMRARAAAHGAARARWAIGAPYRGEERDTLVVRARRPAGGTAPAGAAAPLALAGATPHPARTLDQRGPLALAAAGLLAVPAAALAASAAPLAVLLAVPAGLGWAVARLDRAAAELPDVLPLDRVALAVRDAYCELGELSPRAAASLAIEPRASGYLRVWLKDATPEESARFTRALGDAVDPPQAPRYLISRLVAGRDGAAARLGRALIRRPPFRHHWEAVPADLGSHKRRAEAFAAAWRRWLGPAELLFAQRSDESLEALAAAGAQGRHHEALLRRVWL